jgi:hypothetical protein
MALRALRRRAASHPGILVFDAVRLPPKHHHRGQSSAKSWHHRKRKWQERHHYHQLDSGRQLRSRVRIDTRKWILSKMLPKVYGDKAEVAVTGANGGPVQSLTVSTTDPIEAARTYQKVMGEA